tara:strand:- start:6009 stop:7676 length:1668 start_codon:yes stop_codon:yes gene_type:complete
MIANQKCRPFDPDLLEYCETPQHLAIYTEYERSITVNQTARQLGIDASAVSQTIRLIQKRAAGDHYEPEGMATESLEPDEKVSAKNSEKVDKKLKHKVPTYVITWAQNDTPVDRDFLASIKNYCKHRNALLIVIPGRYRNPTSVGEGLSSLHQEYWADEVAPYLMNHRKVLNPNIVIMGDIKTQPTAAIPLSGLEGITGGMSGVFGHPKVQLKTVATPQHAYPKLLTTTGSITKSNYSDTKAGKKGGFHHIIGATVIEIDGDNFHMRQIAADDDGSFIDLDYLYTPAGKGKAPRAAGLTLGDLHTEFIDEECEKITFIDRNSIIKTLKPEKVVMHDWYDGYSGSHHHYGKVFINYAKHHSGRNNVQEEILRTFDRTKTWLCDDTEFIVVGSNHNEHLLTWLERGEPKLDPENALFYHAMMAKVLSGVVMGETAAKIPNPLEILAREHLELDGMRFLRRKDSLMIAGVENSFHGDKGVNGARGSINSFRDIGVKSNTGHGHSPAIEGGHYRAGTNSRLDLEYAEGLSSWFHTDIVTYANGKRTLLHKIDGSWRAKR